MLAQAVAARVVEKLAGAAATPNAQAPSGAVSEWLDEAAAATHLNVSRKFLEQHRTAGDGPPWHRVGRRAIRYSRADLDAWMRASRR